MQLRRDTEYAIRIMVCIADNMKEGSRETGVPMRDIIAQTSIPRVSFHRICSCLADHDMIRRETSDEGETWLCPGENFWNQSFFSIAEAIEGNMQIFMIFPRNSYLLKKYRTVFDKAQQNVSDALSEITLKSLVNNGK